MADSKADGALPADGRKSSSRGDFSSDLAELLAAHESSGAASAAELLECKKKAVEAIGRGMIELMTRQGHLTEKIDDARASTPSSSADGDEQIRILRVEDKFFGVSTLDSRDTLAKKACGSRTATRIYRFWITWTRTYPVLLPLWLVGAVLSVLAIIELIPAFLALVGALLTLPLQTIQYLLMNRKLALELLREFETSYLLFLSIISLA